MKIELDSNAITDEEIDAAINLLRSWKKKLSPPNALVQNETVVAQIAVGKAHSDLKEGEIESIIKAMHAVALVSENGSEFKTSELYRQALPGKKWNSLSPTDRKAIGRKFRRNCSEHMEDVHTGEKIIVFKERNTQNMAIYQVTTKPAAD